LGRKRYIGLFGGLFVVTVIKGYVHVRAGRVTLHREWTIRAFAVGLAVATQHLIFIPAILVVSAPTQGQLKTLSAAAFLAAFVVHASVAETWIRLTRKRGVPRLGAVTKANLNYPRAREARMEKWNQGAILGAWLIVNPIVFPDPKSDRAWATRAMLGEEMWIAERPLDRAMALNVGATAFGFGGVRGAYKRRLLPTAVCTVGQVALLLAYWREMVAYYERHRTKPPTTAQDVRLWPPE
jgi:hypothetical protein